MQKNVSLSEVGMGLYIACLHD